MFPFLAVGISTVFFFLVSFLEAAGVGTQWLNGPVYYGTLYGPLTWVYGSTKRNVARRGHRHARLPTSSKKKRLSARQKAALASVRKIPGVAGPIPVR